VGAFARVSLMSELEYRFNFAVRIFTDVIWYMAQLSVFEVLFRHTDSLSGWTLETMRVFMGVLFLTDSIYMMLFSENLDRLSDRIRRGDLDLLLVKPVSSQWMLSFQKISVAYFGNFIISAVWLLLWLLICVPCGVIVVYAIRFSTASTALYFTKADAINYIWYQLYRLGTRPDTVYPKLLRYAVLSVLPIAFLASVPAQVILNRTGSEMVLWGIALAAMMLAVSSFIWKTGLKRYASASS
jgi:ABC-2 type transport system permease protein